jgi:predicted component of viral defense system (DUF524 family)
MKKFNIVRDARGKIADTNVDKELDNVAKQIEDKFNGILNKLNAFNIQGTEELRSINTTSPMGDIVNTLSTFVKDLKEILTT